VPFYIVIGKYGVSGAQPPEVWRDVLPKAACEAGGGPALLGG
jgi:predicted DsbA family dithiol-disulfide isomerase